MWTDTAAVVTIATPRGASHWPKNTASANSGRFGIGIARRALPRESGHFDVILADPPYAGAARAELLASEALADRVAPGGVLVVERSRRADVLPPPPGLEPGGSRTYGETVFDWYRKSEDSEG